MRIEIKGRKVEVNDELRERVLAKFEKVGKQVHPDAELEVELFEERNHGGPVHQIAEATLRLKGTSLRARESSSTLAAAVNACADDMARQVKRNREKRRNRREVPRPAIGDAPA